MELYLFYWFSFFFVFPIFEWAIHYTLHYFNEKIHLNHHTNITQNRINSLVKKDYEIWPLLPIIVCVYNTFYIGALYFSKYYIIHTLIHFYPNSIPSLAIHHDTHHVYSKYNFCVTNIWPDIIFKTQYKKIKI